MLRPQVIRDEWTTLEKDIEQSIQSKYLLVCLIGSGDLINNVQFLQGS